MKEGRKEGRAGGRERHRVRIWITRGKAHFSSEGGQVPSGQVASGWSPEKADIPQSAVGKPHWAVRCTLRKCATGGGSTPFEM